MSASPVLLYPSQLTPLRVKPSRDVKFHWVPVVFGLAFISMTSTAFMGGSHTQVLVTDVWRSVFGKWHVDDVTGPLNEILRKTGHFFGYGFISLLFRNAWYKSVRALTWVLRSWLTPVAASLAIVSTFFIASLDEWHQTFLPGRVGCVRDVLLDAAGALVLNLLLWAFLAYKRRKAISAW